MPHNSLARSPRHVILEKRMRRILPTQAASWGMHYVVRDIVPYIFLLLIYLLLFLLLFKPGTALITACLSCALRFPVHIPFFMLPFSNHLYGTPFTTFLLPFPLASCTLSYLVCLSGYCCFLFPFFLSFI